MHKSQPLYTYQKSAVDHRSGTYGRDMLTSLPSDIISSDIISRLTHISDCNVLNIVTSYIMKENKVLIVKTHGGKIMRILREHYLRDDIKHGIGTQLDKSPSNEPNKFCKSKHWILPDTNIFLNNIDAIEQPHFANLIILQTVQNELKRRSAPNYKRLKTLISSGRNCFVFVNDFAIGKLGHNYIISQF